MKLNINRVTAGINISLTVLTQYKCADVSIFFISDWARYDPSTSIASGAFSADNPFSVDDMISGRCEPALVRKIMSPMIILAKSG